MRGRSGRRKRVAHTLRLHHHLCSNFAVMADERTNTPVDDAERVSVGFVGSQPTLTC